MRTFTFRYDPYPARSAFEDMQRAIKTGIPDIQRHSITCQSVEVMMKIMTKSRLQLFSSILEKEPESLTELAEILGKDLGNVQRDATMLQSIGLIELKKIPGKRGEKVKPTTKYDRIIFECEPKRHKKTG